MVKKSTERIELLGTRAVIDEVMKNSPLIKPKVKDGDKDISFDGELELHSSPEWTTKTFSSYIRVQIKGKSDSDFNQKHISFPLLLDHYKNFYNEGGVVFFVVLIDKNENTKIYYKLLLPLELRYILNKNSGKKSFSMRLYPLENQKIQDICRTYLESKKRQPLVLVEKDFTLRPTNRLVLKSTMHHANSFFDNEIFDHVFDVYEGYNDEVLQPAMFAHIKQIKISMLRMFVINGRTVDLNASFAVEKDRFIVVIENILSLDYDFKKGKLNYGLISFGTLEKQDKVLSVLIAHLSGEEILIEDIPLPSLNKPTTKSKNEITNLKKHLEIIKNSISVFKIFNAPLDIEIQPINDESIILQMLSLNEIILENNYCDMELEEHQTIGLVSIQLGNKSLIALYKKYDLNKFSDPFSKDSSEPSIVTAFEEEEIVQPYTILGMFNEEMLIQSINIDANKIISEFAAIKPFSDQRIAGLTQRFYLDCIRAYDQSGKKDLLIAAKYILNRYPNFTNHKKVSDLDWCLNYLNVMQIDMRLNGSIALEDEDTIRDIMHDPNCHKHPDILFGAAVLLKSRNDAQYHLKKIDLQGQEEMKKYPIYTLYENL